MSWTNWYKFDELFQINHFVGHSGRSGKLKTELEGKFDFLSQAEGLKPAAGGDFDYQKLARNEIPIGIYHIRIDARGFDSKFHYYDYIGKAAGLGSDSKFQLGIFGRVYDHYRKLTSLPSRGNIKKTIKALYGPDWNDDEVIKFFSKQSFRDYEELREFFKPKKKLESSLQSTTVNWDRAFSIFKNDLRTHASIQTFFNERVQLRYLQYSPKRLVVAGDGQIDEKKLRSAAEEISKWEGLALCEYQHLQTELHYLINSRDETRSGLSGFKQGF